MNKMRKGFLTAGSIVTIVSVLLGILGSVVLFVAAHIFTEKFIIKTFESETNYTFTEEADGGYVISYTDDGDLVEIEDETINLIVKVGKIAFVVMGIGSLALSIAKLVFGILVLLATLKEKFAKGKVITLLVLSLISSSILEAVLIIVGMCYTDDKKNSTPSIKGDVEQITIE